MLLRALAPLVLAFVFLPTWARAQECTPSTALSCQFRTGMKHRAPGAAAPRAVMVAEVMSWGAPAGVDELATRQREAPIDPHEGEVVSLEADLWQFKIEDNDCDLHLELTAPGAGRAAPRIIAEIPAGPAFAAARDAVLSAIPMGGELGVGHPMRLDAPVRLRPVGYPFWDGAH